MEGRLIIIGAGGHGRVVADAAGSTGITCVFLDARATSLGGQRLGASVDGVPVEGDEKTLATLVERGDRWFVMGIGQSGDASVRRGQVDAAHAAGARAASVLHGCATVSNMAFIGAGTVVLARAVVNPGARVGSHVIVNTAAVVEHDVVVGDHAHLAPGAVVCGEVTVGEGAYLGAGSVVRQGISIGPGAIVGAGAVVIRDVAPGETVVGVPARSR